MSRSAATPQPLRPTGGLTPQRPTAGEGAESAMGENPTTRAGVVIRIAVAEPAHAPQWEHPAFRRLAGGRGRAGDRRGTEEGRSPWTVGEGSPSNARGTRP